MPDYFLDSSAAAKRYLAETGSRWIKGLFAQWPRNRFYTVATTGVEVVAAISRRARGGTLSASDAANFRTLFLLDLRADYRNVPVTDGLLDQAIHLAQKHSLRGYDAVQLAAATEINNLRIRAGAATLIFVCSDKELNAAAQSEGLTIDDPNMHP